MGERYPRFALSFHMENRVPHKYFIKILSFFYKNGDLLFAVKSMEEY